MKYKKLSDKQLILIMLLLLIIECFMLSETAFAATSASDSWNYTDYSHGYYVPKSGNMKMSCYQSNGKYRVKTVVTMNLNATNVSRIKLYNSADTSAKVHEKCRGINTYLTCDVTSIPTSGIATQQDSMHATSVTSDLPNPKYDLENDNSRWDDRNEESETVALGTVSAKTYQMTTYWDDMRGANGLYTGSFLCQYSMSKKGLSDYNTVICSDVVQAKITYGKKQGVI